MATMSRAVSITGFERHPRRSLQRAVRSRRFGRRAPYVVETAPPATRAISDDLRLFASTFAAGFLFVSVLIG